MNGKWTGMLAVLTFGIGAASYAATALPDDMSWTFAPLSEAPNLAAAPDPKSGIVDAATPDFVVALTTPAPAETAAPVTTTVAPVAAPAVAQTPESATVSAASAGGTPVPLETITAVPATPSVPPGPVYHAPDYPPPSYIPGSNSEAGGVPAVSAFPPDVNVPSATPASSATATATQAPAGVAASVAQAGTGKSNNGNGPKSKPAPDPVAIFVSPTVSSRPLPKH
jgi:hypothetical protein